MNLKSIEIDGLIAKEGWSIIKEGRDEYIIAYGQKFPKTHPLAVHLKLYRTEKNPELKFIHMKAAHDYLWPEAVWHYWTERRFREHCKAWKYISYAGGASTGKSYDAAKIALLFWLANPKGRAVIVASTTLESLNARIWGYCTKLLHEAAVKLPYIMMRGAPPKILFDRNDTIHGMFCLAAKQGDDDKAISSVIGRHPNEGLMIILDEATDTPPAILKALPNLESGVEIFQCMAIGNSLSKFDLHGAISTPKAGWATIDAAKDVQWETTQKHGTCLFFSCYESPAILDPSPETRAKLARFLITQEQITEKEKLYGKDSDAFYRFVLGFWRLDSTDDTIISKQFISDFSVFDRAQWSGIHPLHVVAGLDPAFSTGGDQCILRLAILGQATNGQIVLDFRGDEFVFKIAISATSEKSADLQIADQVLKILSDFNVGLQDLCVDANGQGRALGEVLRLRAKSIQAPIKIYSTAGGNKQVRSFDVVIKTNHELWFAFREFIQHGQIKGLDRTAVMQLTTRKVLIKGGKQYLEAKKDYKTRMGAVAPSLAHSPDEADACSLALQVAMQNYGFTPGQRQDDMRARSFEHEKFWVFNQIRKVEEQQRVVEEENAPPVADFLGDVADIKLPFS